MTKERKYEAFHREELNKNEEKQGEQVEERFGHENIDQADDKYVDMSQDEIQSKNEIESELFKQLDEIVDNGATLERQQKATDLHKEWLTYSWPTYTEERHLEMVNMYDEDARFREYFGDERSKVLITAVRHVLEN